MLSLAEEMLLLSLDDKTGRFPVWASCGISGAILTELFLRHRVELVGKDVVRVKDPSPTRDDVLDFALALIKDADRYKGVRSWLWTLSRKPAKVRDALAQRLVDQGILDREAGSTLGLFAWVRYPQADGRVKNGIVAELREVLLSGKTPDSRTGSLIALAKACDVMGTILDRRERKQTKARIKEICSGQALPSEVHGAVQALQELLATVTIITSG